MTAVQPRIRLTRSFDQRSHTYLGYILRVRATPGGAGDRVAGQGVPIADPRTEIAALYKVSKLEVRERGSAAPGTSAPWHGAPPALPVYRERGHRRLDARTYESKCTTCIWGCRMPVEMIIDQWNPTQKEYRQETFCYGPLACRLYKAGPTRKVPGRKGMSWEEENWVDEDAVSHRERKD